MREQPGVSGVPGVSGQASGKGVEETRCVESKGFPLFERFPPLAELPRATLGVFPSPVERVTLAGGHEVWLKRDDRNAPVAAGNKVRALEFLLGSVHPGDVVLTAGGQGSTHVYATAVHAARLGAATRAIRWPQDMHPLAEAVAREAERHCAVVDSTWTVVGALVRVAASRLGATMDGRGVARLYVPIGGSSALGVLGHVNAGLELAQQVAAGVLPEPTHVVVPLGSGGTAAGLALGLGIGGIGATVVAARVAPRTVANAPRVRSLIRRTRRLMRRLVGSGTPLPAAPVVVDHSVYGGAYGRPLAAGARAATLFDRAVVDAGGLSVMLDATYAAKAGAAALALDGWERPPGRATGGAGRRVLLWVTFDGRGFETHSARLGAGSGADL
jgi:D-cysteine desulfhydrase